MQIVKSNVSSSVPSLKVRTLDAEYIIAIISVAEMVREICVGTVDRVWTIEPQCKVVDHFVKAARTPE